MRTSLPVALFALTVSAAPLLFGCTQDENSSNSDRDTHMGSARMSPLPPALPEVVAAVAPSPAPAAPAASASAPASASAAASAPAPAASASASAPAAAPGRKKH